MCFKKKFIKIYPHLRLVLLFCLFLSSLYLAVFLEPTIPYHTENRLVIKPGTSKIFTPGIGILKIGEATNSGGSPGCDEIRYRYEITNESTEGEILTNVVVTDMDLGGLVGLVPTSGDINVNGLLEPNETWIFTATHNITNQNLIAGQFGENPASVIADVQNQGVQVSDISHPSLVTDEGPTIVDLTSCQKPEIGIIKEEFPQDLDNDLCFESVLYRFTVGNVGHLPLQNIVVTDNLLGGVVPGPVAGNDINNDGIMSPGEEWTYQVLYAIDLQMSGQVKNQATVQGESQQDGQIVQDLSHDEQYELSGDTTTSYDEVCTSGFARIQLVKESNPVDLNGDLCNDAINYTFTIRNGGDADLRNIELVDDRLGLEFAGPFAGDNNNNGILESTEVWTYTIQYWVTQQDINEGLVSNQATVTGQIIDLDFLIFDNSDDTEFDEDDPTVEDVSDYCPVLNIGLRKEGNLRDLNQDGCNETIEYVFTVENIGLVDLENIQLTDETLFGDEPIVNLTPGQDENGDGVLSVGENWEYVVLHPITQGDIDIGIKLNQAFVTAVERNEGNPVSDYSHPSDLFNDGDTQTITADACVSEPAIALTKSGTPIDLSGDGCPETIRYLFTVINTGSKDLENITLVDNDLFIDDSFETPLLGQDIGNDEILSVGESWIYEAFYSITQTDINTGFVNNQAMVSANERGTNVVVIDESHPDDITSNGVTQTMTNGTCVAGAAIGLRKIGVLTDINNDGCPETIQYEFTVENTGTEDLTGISISDEPLLGDQIIDTPLSGEDENADGILSPQESWVFEVFYPLTQSDIDVGFVNNQATVTAFASGVEIQDLSDNDSFAENDETQTLTDGACPAGPSISLIKEYEVLDGNSDGCDEQIRYIFTVENTGTVDLLQVELRDELLFGDLPISGPITGEDENNDGELSVGENWVYEAFYPISNADIEAGEVVNRARVVALDVETSSVVADESHPTDPNSDGDTITPLDNACDFGPNIGLVKVGELRDLDGDDCPDTIQYTFVVTNTGTRNLELIEITNEFLSPDAPIDGPVPAVDVNNDEVLSPNEYWVYVVLHSITEDDINLGEVENQAEVVAFEEGTDIQVIDESDYESNWEDRPTLTPLEDDCLVPDNPEPPVVPDGDFEIYNGLTPNGDGLNDYFLIKGIENYPNNNLKIYNRWGVLVYEADQYGIENELFGGTSFGRATIATGKELPSGTYYYILTFFEENPGQPDYTGYLYINRE